MSAEQRVLLQLAELSGACAGHDPELWFADERHRADQNEAKRICAGCPKVAECQSIVLLYELEHRSHLFGIYGGLTETERLTIKKMKKGASA